MDRRLKPGFWQAYLASDLIDQMSDAVMLVDLYGTIVACNLELCRRVGYPRDQLVGATPGVWHKDDENYGDLTRKIISATLEHGHWRGLVDFTSTIGERRLSEVQTVPFRDPSGEIVAVLSVSRDVTGRVRPPG